MESASIGLVLQNSVVWSSNGFSHSYVFIHKGVMSGGSGGSGGGGGVHGDGDAHGAAPQAQRSLGSRGGRTPAPSPCRAAWTAWQAAVGGGAAESEGFWSGTWNRELWPSAACCDCAAEGAGGGLRVELGVAGGTHPDPRDLRRCHRAASFGWEGGNRGICWICHLHYYLHFPYRLL